MTPRPGNPLVIFADPQDATILYQQAALAALVSPPDCLLDDAGELLTVSARFPDGQTGAPAVPHLQVRFDGTPTVLYPVTEWSTIGLVAWYPPGRKSDAKDAASIIGGLMSVHPGSADIRQVKPLTGRTADVDPDTGLYFVTSTFRVSTRSVPL